MNLNFGDTHLIAAGNKLVEKTGEIKSKYTLVFKHRHLEQL